MKILVLIFILSGLLANGQQYRQVYDSIPIVYDIELPYSPPNVVLKYFGDQDKPIPTIVFYTSSNNDTIFKPFFTNIKVTDIEFKRILEAINDRHYYGLLKAEPVLQYGEFHFVYETEEEEVVVSTSRVGSIAKVFKNISEVLKKSPSSDLVRRSLKNISNRIGIPVDFD